MRTEDTLRTHNSARWTITPRRPSKGKFPQYSRSFSRNICVESGAGLDRGGVAAAAVLIVRLTRKTDGMGMKTWEMRYEGLDI